MTDKWQIKRQYPSPFNKDGGIALRDMLRTVTARRKGHLDICDGVCTLVRMIATAEEKLSLVVGIIGSDGPAFVERNMKILEDYTTHVRKNAIRPTFSASDIFSVPAFDGYRQMDVNTQWIFWHDILFSGVETVIMTPRWEKSVGARSVHTFAQAIKINIEDKSQDPALLEILRANGVEA